MQALISIHHSLLFTMNLSTIEWREPTANESRNGVVACSTCGQFCKVSRKWLLEYKELEQKVEALKVEERLLREQLGLADIHRRLDTALTSGVSLPRTIAAQHLDESEEEQEDGTDLERCGEDDVC